MVKVYLDSKNQNKRYDVSELVTEVKVTSEFKSSAGKLDFTLIKDSIVIFHEGDAVSVYDDELPIFYGYVFTKTANEKREIQTVAYDQLRYLKAKDSLEFFNASVTDVINTIAKYLQLEVGEITQTGYKTPYYYHENESFLDIIDYHLQQAKLLDGTEYVFYDDFGKLTLSKAEDLLSNYVIGNDSLATSYSYKTDIDSNTYNVIKLIQPNKETGGGDVYLAKDDDTIKRWGMLQYYEKMDENLNAEQIKEYLKTLATYHNKVFRTLSLEALGIPGLRGGSTLFFDIPNIGDIAIDKYLIVDKVTHTYKSDQHTMSLELTVR